MYSCLYCYDITEPVSYTHLDVYKRQDVKGAFDAGWWPTILLGLKNFKYPKNLYRTVRTYFSERTATLTTNTATFEREVTKGCPQGSCCGPGFWNVQYNSQLNLNFNNITKAIAFANDLILAVSEGTSNEAENFSNMDIPKVASWAENNKICFNKEKYKK